MTVLAGRAALVKVCATDGSYTALNGVVSPKADGWNFSTMIDTTQQGDTATRAEQSGFYGDCTLSFELYRIVADPGQVILFANNPVWVQYAPDGTTFKKCQMQWAGPTSHASGPDGTKVSVTMKPAGGVAPASV